MSTSITRLRPNQRAAEERRSAEIDGYVHHEQLMALLSEFLAVERGGIQLYTLALERSADADIRAAMRESLNVTLRHADLLEKAIRDLGGDPTESSASALIQTRRIESWLRLEADPSIQEMADLENLVLGETKCQMDWELLRALTPYVDDPQTREILGRVLDEVEEESEGDAHWAKETLTHLKLRQLVRPRDQSQAA